MAFFIIFFIIFFVLPKAWLSYSMNRYDNDLEGMPFNAEEFGRSILKENDMEDVIIEETNMVDHYDLNDRAVRVKEGRLKKKSLTALAIICHEIGHAIKHKEQYGPLVRRTDIVKNTQWLTRFGGIILYSGLPIILATGNFGLIKICLILALCSVLLGVFIHLVTLNVELDASFKRAMPILEKKIPQEYHSACKSILRVCAFTYVIASLTSILKVRNLWMFVRIFLFRR